MATTATSPVDFDAMSESEFLAFVTRELWQLDRSLKWAIESLRASNESLRRSAVALGGAPPPELTVVQAPDSEEGDDDGA
jgi:hypothetical protein